MNNILKLTIDALNSLYLFALINLYLSHIYTQILIQSHQHISTISKIFYDWSRINNKVVKQFEN